MQRVVNRLMKLDWVSLTAWKFFIIAKKAFSE